MNGTSVLRQNSHHFQMYLGLCRNFPITDLVVEHIGNFDQHIGYFDHLNCSAAVANID